MEQACCSAAFIRLGDASLDWSQDARPNMMLARSRSLHCRILASATSSRNGIATGAYPKVPHAQKIEDRLRGVSSNSF